MCDQKIVMHNRDGEKYIEMMCRHVDEYQPHRASVRVLKATVAVRKKAFDESKAFMGFVG